MCPCYTFLPFPHIVCVLVRLCCVVETFSDRPVWWHDMVISVPRRIIDPSVAFLYIGEGLNEPDRYGYVLRLPAFSTTNANIIVTCKTAT